MRFPNDNSPIPSYTRYVLVTSFQAGISIFLMIYAWVAMVVIFGRGFVPDLGELADAGVHYLALVGYGVSQFFTIYIQNERWQELFRRPEKPQTPQRPMVRMQSVMVNHAQFRTGDRQYMPLSPSHYAAVYKALRMNDWKITKRLLKNVEGDDGLKFMDIDKYYMNIVHHWVSLDLIEGWEEGRRHETWRLSEKGRELFAEYGYVTDSPYYPTENN